MKTYAPLIGNMQTTTLLFASLASDFRPGLTGTSSYTKGQDMPCLVWARFLQGIRLCLPELLLWLLLKVSMWSVLCDSRYSEYICIESMGHHQSSVISRTLPMLSRSFLSFVPFLTIFDAMRGMVSLATASRMWTHV